MAKRKSATRRSPKVSVVKTKSRPAVRSRKKPSAARKKSAPRKPVTKKPAPQKPAAKKKAALKTARPAPVKTPRLDRARRRLEEDDTVQSPPSSLDMDRRGSAVRTGRAEVEASLRNHRGMSPSIRGGDVDVDIEDAYFTGDEAPGGDNPTPDQEVVDDIGKALGVQYEDHEELKGSDKIIERDKHRWELDPASSEDYQKRR